nr:hypothetical protein [Tanacetum cinerariifolium]
VPVLCWDEWGIMGKSGGLWWNGAGSEGRGFVESGGKVVSVQCVSVKRIAWNEFSCSMASAVICLATVDDLTSHNTKYTSLALTQKVQPLPQAAEEDEEVKVPTAPTDHLLTMLFHYLPQDPTPTPHATPPASLTQEQQTLPNAFTLPLLTTLMETCATLSKKGEKIEAIDADEDITLVDVETQEEVVAMDVELHGRIYQDDEVNAANKGVNAIEPTVFDDEEVTMTMAQTLIKMKDKKAKLIDEQIAQRLHDEEVKKAAARDKGMTYDKVRPIFKREYKKVQTLFKPDKNVEEPKKKRVAEETLLQESFKKLKAVKVSGSESTQETSANDPKEMSEEDVQNMLEIIPVSEFKVEALQVKYLIIDWEIYTEVKEKFSSAVPSVDKEKTLWVELKRLFKPDADDVLWKLQRHDMFMLTEKHYPLSNSVMTLMLSAKLQVEEDSEMARDLVMKIFMEANKPKSRSKVDTTAEVTEEITLSGDLAMVVSLEHLMLPTHLTLFNAVEPFVVAVHDVWRWWSVGDIATADASYLSIACLPEMSECANEEFWYDIDDYTITNGSAAIKAWVFRAEIVRDLAWQIVTFAATVDASFLSIASLPEMSECAHGEPSADFENTGRIAESDNRSPPQPPQPCLDRLRSSVTWRGRLLHLQLRRMHPVCQLLAYLRCQNALTEVEHKRAKEEVRHELLTAFKDYHKRPDRSRPYVSLDDVVVHNRRSLCYQEREWATRKQLSYKARPEANSRKHTAIYTTGYAHHSVNNEPAVFAVQKKTAAKTGLDFSAYSFHWKITNAIVTDTTYPCNNDGPMRCMAFDNADNIRGCWMPTPPNTRTT